MDTSFNIKADWLKRPEHVQRDIAQLSFWVGETALTQLADVETGENRTYFRTSAVSLALWVADNWWRLRYEPLHDSRRPSADWRLRHELSSISGGSLWPPLMIYGTGERVTVSSAFGASLAAGPVRYLDLASVYSLPGEIFENGVDKFLAEVSDTCAQAQDGTTLSALIMQLRDERADEGVAAWRRLEARLGYDADGAPEDLMARLSDLEDRLGERAVEEAAVSAPGAESSAALEAALKAAETSGVEIDLSIADVIAPAELRTAPTPWRAGEAAALAVRKAISAPSGPLEERALSQIAGRPWAQIISAPAAEGGLRYGAHLADAAHHSKLALQTQLPIDRRYEVIRIVGDALWGREERFGVVSRAKTERQQFQRAFAQSLLLPFDELSEIIDFDEPTDDQMEVAADRYHVRPKVVETALVVKGVLPRETLVQRLEAAW